VSPPSALSPIGETVYGAHIPFVAKSHGSNSNTLAYAKCAVPT